MQVFFTFCCKLMITILHIVKEKPEMEVLKAVEIDFIQEQLQYGKRDRNIELGSILKTIWGSRDL